VYRSLATTCSRAFQLLMETRSQFGLLVCHSPTPSFCIFLVGADHATHNLDTENNNLTEANYYLSIRYSIKKIDDDDCWKKRNIRLHRIFYPD
jgi:hypothetical protein